MSEAKFTKKMEVGIPSDNAALCVDGFCNVDGQRFEVCSVWGVDDEDTCCDQTTANAHLIAAAPEMYETLETIALVLEGRTVFSPDEISSEGIREILAKARGE